MTLDEAIDRVRKQGEWAAEYERVLVAEIERLMQAEEHGFYKAVFVGIDTDAKLRALEAETARLRSLDWFLDVLRRSSQGQYLDISETVAVIDGMWDLGEIRAALEAL